jgi:hypothetical protein
VFVARKIRTDTRDEILGLRLDPLEFIAHFGE